MDGAQCESHIQETFWAVGEQIEFLIQMRYDLTKGRRL